MMRVQPEIARASPRPHSAQPSLPPRAAKGEASKAASNTPNRIIMPAATGEPSAVRVCAMIVLLTWPASHAGSLAGIAQSLIAVLIAAAVSVAGGLVIALIAMGRLVAMVAVAMAVSGPVAEHIGKGIAVPDPRRGLRRRRQPLLGRGCDLVPAVCRWLCRRRGRRLSGRSGLGGLGLRRRRGLLSAGGLDDDLPGVQCGGDRVCAFRTLIRLPVDVLRFCGERRDHRAEDESRSEPQDQTLGT